MSRHASTSAIGRAARWLVGVPGQRRGLLAIYKEMIRHLRKKQRQPVKSELYTRKHSWIDERSTIDKEFCAQCMC